MAAPSSARGPAGPTKEEMAQQIMRLQQEMENLRVQGQALQDRNQEYEIKLAKKVMFNAPEPYKGGIGADAKQWLARMMGWLTISGSQFSSNKDIIMFLLINMEGAAAAWALPHIRTEGADLAGRTLGESHRKCSRLGHVLVPKTVLSICGQWG